MPFKPGVSGNDKGRPPNSGHRQKLFNALVLPHKEKLINQAIEMALNGNETMLKLLLERILPAKPTDDSLYLTLPDNKDFTQATTLLDVGANIIKAISTAEITPDEGKALLEIISAQRKSIETGVLAERITEIEFLLSLRNKEHTNEKR